ncbi:MAG TPA: hypothetical protein VLK85_09730 [Ramlibacter sp.]|nr:hypothetical protein [Ramlibacter sp.]
MAASHISSSRTPATQPAGFEKRQMPADVGRGPLLAGNFPLRLFAQRALHYTMAQIRELHAAREKITKPSNAWNKGLQALRAEAAARKAQRAAGGPAGSAPSQVPQKSPSKSKGLTPKST